VFKVNAKYTQRCKRNETSFGACFIIEEALDPIDFQKHG
jgi:hypothetical protein